MSIFLKKISIGLVILLGFNLASADEPPVCNSVEVSKPLIHNRLAFGGGYQKKTVKWSSARTSTARKNKLIRAQSVILKSVFPAQVLEIEGDVLLVERQGVGLAQPIRLSSGDQLQLHDVIQTYGQSFISIELGDGVRMVLPSNSRVQLAQVNNRLARIKLLSGRIENYVPKRSKAKSNVFEIQTPAVVLGVRGTYFRAEYHPDRQISTANVLEGTVAVSTLGTCAAPLMIQAGQGVSVQTSIPEQATALLDGPVLIEKNKDAQINEQVQIQVEPVVGAVKYHAELSLDNAFLNKYRESFSTTNQLLFNDIPSGFYFLRLTAIDAKGIEGQYTEHFFLRNHRVD